jgi:hypothetical protein
MIFASHGEAAKACSPGAIITILSACQHKIGWKNAADTPFHRFLPCVNPLRLRTGTVQSFTMRMPHRETSFLLKLGDVIKPILFPEDQENV